MPVEFSRTLRSLRADRSRSFAVALGLITVLFILWAAWMELAHVSVYAVSDKTRLETASQLVQSLYGGRVTANHLVLGREVKRGDVLVELDTNTQRLQLAEERSQGTAIQAETAALWKAIATEEMAMREDAAAADLGIQEAQARLREAEASAAFARLDSDRKATLNAEGLLPQLDLMRANSEMQKQKANVESLQLATSRQQQEKLTRLSERRSRIQSLKREATRLSGQTTREGAAVDRLESEVQLRRVVAQIDGTIGEAASLRAGAVVSPGEKLGTIVPGGGLHLVAQFIPAMAAGRIRQGQRARVRLDGFPWTQYGTLPATVVKVANEVRDGLLRVELIPEPGSRIPLQHGLPGTTEIEVERVTPLALLIRLTGQMLASHSSTGSSGDTR